MCGVDPEQDSELSRLTQTEHRGLDFLGRAEGEVNLENVGDARER